MINKYLYLLRHSYAEQQNYSNDFDRIIIKKGYNVLNKLNQHLRSISFEVQEINCSSSRRTKETTRYLLEGLGLSELAISYYDNLYDGSVDDYIESIRDFTDSSSHGMIVGHNPEITTLSGILANKHLEHVKPGGIVTLTLAEASWGGIGKSFCQFKSYYHPSL